MQMAGCLHGNGILKYANGDIYKGKWRNGNKHDESGAMFYANGDVYCGEWVNGVRGRNGVWKKVGFVAGIKR